MSIIHPGSSHMVGKGTREDCEISLSVGNPNAGILAQEGFALTHHAVSNSFDVRRIFFQISTLNWRLVD